MTRFLPPVGQKTPRHRIFHRLRLSHAALALIIALSLLGQAQFQAAMAADVEEVIVTAQRRSERLENVPMSVAVVSAETLNNSGIVSLNELSQVASGVLISNAGFQTQPSIRGVSTTLSGNFYENNVAVYIDGLYQANPINVNSDFANLAGIQVLKGPQGTLYGRNATGGAILITTLAPSKTFTANVQASYAEFNEKTFSGYISGPITDRIRFGIAAYSRSSDGYYKFSDPTTGLPTDRNTAPIKKQYVRVKLEADLADNLTATVGYNYSKYDDGTALQYTPFANFAATFPAPPVRSPTPLVTKSANVAPVNLFLTQEATLKLDWKAGFGTLTSTSSYVHERQKNFFDLDGSYADLTRLNTQFPRNTYQTNLTADITSIKNLDLVVGGMYFKDVVSTERFWTYGTGGVITTMFNQKGEKEAFSLYLDGTYSLTDEIKITAGGAYAHEKSTNSILAQSPAQVIAGTYTIPPTSKSATFKKFTPRASIRYEFQPQTSVYFSYSQGFKAGQWQSGLPPGVPVRQESVNAFELGFKMARPEFRFETSGFYYNYKDIQSSVTIPDPLCTTPPNCNIRVLIFNGPAARIYGIDGDLTWTPDDHLSVRAGAAWVHARYRTFTNAVGTGLNTTTNTLVPNQTQDWSGQQMPRAPNISGNLGVDYKVPVDFGEIMLSTNATFTSAYVVSNASLYGPQAGASLASKQRFRQGGYALLNGSITWTDKSGRYSLSFFGRNLTDKKYWLLYSSSGSFGDYGVYAPPRVFGGRVKAQF